MLKLGPPFRAIPLLLFPKPADNASESAWHWPQNCRYSALPMAGLVAGVGGLVAAYEAADVTTATATATLRTAV